MPWLHVKWNYVKIISQACDNMFIVAELTLKNFRTPSAAEIILFQFQTWLHVK